MKNLLRYRLIRGLVIVLLIPYALTPLYRFIPPPSTLMLWDMVQFHVPKRQWVSLKEISPNAMAAVLAAEDSAFCDHFGFDFRQLSKSVERSVDHDKPIRATSTITQQTAKNLFLWHGRSWLRKLLEAPLTVWLELILSKKRILEIYLNIAQWGDGVYGIEAASQHYFSLPASKLNATQAALLAGALPSPIRRNAGNPSLFHQALAASIIRKINQQNMQCLR